MQSYDYSHRQGVEEISWERFAQLSATLTEKLAGIGVETVVGIARAGLFPALPLPVRFVASFFPYVSPVESMTRCLSSVRFGGLMSVQQWRAK